mgnify:CR=1 FL=1
MRWVTYRLGHTDTGIADGQGLLLLVGDDVDAEVLARVELGRVREGLIADLVEGVGGVGDELSQEDLLVGVDSVDDQRQKLRDLSLELEGLGRHLCGANGYAVKRGKMSVVRGRKTLERVLREGGKKERSRAKSGGRRESF